jgi:hypothetical protein
MDNIKEMVKITIQASYPHEVNRYINKKYVVALPEFLDPNEKLEAVVFGKIPDLFGPTAGGLWATDRRLAFLCTHILGKSISDFTYGSIEGINVTPSWPRSVVIKTTGNRNLMLQHVDIDIATKFVNQVRQIMENRLSANLSQNNQPSNDLVEQLEKLAALKDTGVIDENEFALAKKKLLEEI